VPQARHFNEAANVIGASTRAGIGVRLEANSEARWRTIGEISHNGAKFFPISRVSGIG